MENAKLLCDISELNHLFRDSANVETFLQQIVEMVCKHMKANVCSIYLYDEDEKVLVLKANKGLKQESIGKVRLKLGEGLTGISVKELRPISISEASRHPDSKMFSGTGEEEFENFLSMPISRGVQRIGALVLQRQLKYPFSEADILTCKAVASQLANIIENARFLISLHTPHEPKEERSIIEELRFIKGKVASEGYCHSQSLFVDKQRTFKTLLQKKFSSKYNIQDFKKAIKKTAEQLENMQSEVEEKLNDAASLIFASHLLILKDHEFVGQMENFIEQGINAPEAVLSVAKRYIDIFSVSENVFVREKVQDVEDLTVRIVNNLLSAQDGIVNYEGKVVIAEDLFPSDLLKMTSEKVGGIVLVSGGVTSHLSILARSLQVPMVIANIPGLLNVPDKTEILLDADTGNIYLEPTDEIISEFDQRNKERLEVSEFKYETKPETISADGTKITLMANINLLSDLKLAHKVKCEGVGLYRTEFPFIIRNSFPSEEEQYLTYRKLVESMDGKPVVFRTLDVGGDKMLSYYHNVKEQNPAIGMRSIRFTLQNRDVFEQQVRAILRAGYNADLKIMFPMISSLDEFDEAKAVVKDCIKSLESDGFDFNSNPEIGMMVELPSVVELMDEFAQEADFFSIGTNDFIQFILGVDRTNEKVANCYMPYHPSVLRAMKKVVESANRNGKPISVCGSMSNDSRYIKFLIGIGLRTLSLNPSYLPRVQQMIESLHMDNAEKYVDILMSKSRASEVAEVMGITNN